MDWFSEIAERVTPTAAVPLEGRPLVLTVVTAAVIVTVPQLWRALRPAITLVHELGHAFVGVLLGRRFTGFVVRGDMSGHAVTVGPARGIGRIGTTWAGYPMPGLVGAAMIATAQRGWSAPLLSALLVTLLLALLRIRSPLTLVVMMVTLGALGSAWWWGEDALQSYAMVATGIILLVGGWRHLTALRGAGSGDRNSDPAVLARLTRIPALLWTLSFVLVMAAATVASALMLLPA